MKSILERIKEITYYVKFYLTKPTVGQTQLLTMAMKFERDPDGSWYAVVENWEGPRGALLMVAGADTLLEFLANGKDEITLNVSNDYEAYEIWNRRQTTYVATATDNSGNYHVTPLNRDIWLCGVNVFVWGFHPQHIYFCVKEV